MQQYKVIVKRQGFKELLGIDINGDFVFSSYVDSQHKRYWARFVVEGQKLAIGDILESVKTEMIKEFRQKTKGRIPINMLQNRGKKRHRKMPYGANKIL